MDGARCNLQRCAGPRVYRLPGRIGLFNLGWAHPKVVGAVQAQLEKSPLPTQELLDPLRGMLAHLMAEITPGDIQYSFFVSSGTEAVEGAMKLARLYTRKSGFIAAVRGFHGKTAGALSLTGKAIFRKPALLLQITSITFPMAMLMQLNSNCV